MTQLELLEIAHRAITREIRKKYKRCEHLEAKRSKVARMIKAEKEKNNEQ